MKSNRRARRVKVSADRTGLVSRADTLLLRELCVDIGLVQGWTEELLDTYKVDCPRNGVSGPTRRRGWRGRLVTDDHDKLEHELDAERSKDDC